MSAVYKWANGSHHKVTAQTAGEELKRIEDKYGGLKAEDIVDESHSKDAVLHICFEWNDPIAAKLHRETQAKELCRHIVIVYEQEENEESQPIEIRAFHSIVDNEEQRKYISTEYIMSDEDFKAQLIQEASKEFQAYKKKYNNIIQFAEIVFKGS